jgi:hypothetical protein
MGLYKVPQQKDIVIVDLTLLISWLQESSAVERFSAAFLVLSHRFAEFGPD